MNSRRREADPVNMPRERKMQEQTEVVALLTKSNHNILGRKAGLFKRMRGLTPREKAYEEVTRQAAGYLKVVESSLRVSLVGISITKTAISLLETPTRNPVQLMAGLRSHAEECRLEAQNMETEFRKVRTQIWSISQTLGISYKTSDQDESSTVEIEKLRDMGDVDLFDLFAQVINQLTGTIARFVAWWDDATINWKNIKEHMITFKHGNDVLIKEWRDLQLQYQLYREEIMAQQDYYSSKLKP
ncbi:hypothetical protein PC9H_005881 [Pleurotus ostreatus]|uniref:Uncharacterized protein n=1 Tax=Pleurotus ostreatus TaxID=5322 RepID=A0A8H6ZZX8_PLEOS|nr:uncharacterized protein PC9H_005881 [Pleurotus ostreatus]KAF7430181.1 hypothetical protein PC9H_005881 [Pleurotus ostreatus]